MIPANQHSVTITKKVVARFNEDIPVRMGVNGFFPRDTTPTLMVDVEVQRDSEDIAVDVQRFTEGNKNKFSRSTEHTYLPPYYNEEYLFARDEIYMNTVALGVTGSRGSNQAIAQNALKNMRSLRKKIERAILKQQVDALQVGVITVKNGDSIDFRRKATSMVDLGALQYWGVTGVKPMDHLRAGMSFLRDEGNSTGGTVNVIMRGEAYEAFVSNASVQETANLRRINRIDLNMPQFNEASGMAYHGQIDGGDFVLNLWTYNEKYRDEAGNNVYYLDANKVIMLPSDFKGKTIFGGLPTMVSGNVGGVKTDMPSVVETEYLIRSFSEPRTISSGLELSSAPLVVPYTIDKIYTLQVLA